MYYNGGYVHSSRKGEYGFAQVKSNVSNILFKGFPNESQVWMSHGDEVKELPTDWEVISRSTNNIIAAVQKKESKIFGVQFHPEVVHTIYGKELLSNFIFDIAKCKPEWTPENFTKNTIENIKNKTQDTLLVSLCDKYHNANCILSDYQKVGEEIWGRFTASKQETLWYYESLYKEFKKYLKNHLELIKAYKNAVDEMKRIIQ